MSLRNGNVVKTLEPERRGYKASRQPTSEVAIWRRLNEDVYVNFAGSAEGTNKAVIQAYVFPLVSWIWIGFWVLSDRNDRLPDSEQGKAAIRANPGCRRHVQTIC